MIKECYSLFGWNQLIFKKINFLTNSSILPYILQYISKLFFIGNFVIVYILICLFIYYKIHNISDPLYRLKYFNKYYHEFFRIGICYILFGLSFAFLKYSINLPRPFCSLSTHEFYTIANTETKRCLSSFPSAHTALSFLMSYIIWNYVNIYGKILSIFAVILVALSRITLAMHYPSDILYSILIITIIIIFSNKIYFLLKNKISFIGIYIFQLLFMQK